MMKYRAHGYMYVNSIDFLEKAFELIGTVFLTVLSGGSLSSVTLMEFAGILSQIATQSVMASRLLNVLERLLQNIHSIEYVDTDDVSIRLSKGEAFRGTELIEYLKIEYESNSWHPWALVYWLYQFAESEEEREAVSQFATLLMFAELDIGEYATVELDARMPFEQDFYLLLHHKDVKKAGANKCYELSFFNPATYKAINISLSKIVRNALNFTVFAIARGELLSLNTNINPTHIYRIPYIRHGYKCKLHIYGEGESSGRLRLTIPSYNEQELYYSIFYLSSVLNLLIQKRQTIADEHGFKRLKLYEELQAFDRIEFSNVKIVDSSRGFEFSKDEGSNEDREDGQKTEGKWLIALLLLILWILWK